MGDEMADRFFVSCEIKITQMKEDDIGSHVIDDDSYRLTVVDSMIVKSKDIMVEFLKSQAIEAFEKAMADLKKEVQ
jgi:hypothetical protein